MEEEDMIWQMDLILMVNGVITKSMGEVFCFLRVENLNMMGSGEMIYFMDGGPSIPKLLIGTNTKVNFEMGSKKGGEG